jgi:chromosome segregation ATPase
MDYTPRSADVVTNSIPPEGDEYNARRQEELHAAVLNKSQLTRRMLEMVRADAPTEQIGAVIDAIAQIDREIPHISKDLAVSVQGRNLTIFLDRMDTSLEQSTGRVLASVQTSLDRMLDSISQVLGRIVKVEREVKMLKKGQTVSTAELKKCTIEIADLRGQVKALGAVAETANRLTEETNRLNTETNRLTAETNRLAEEHNRFNADHEQLAQRVHDLEALVTSMRTSGG